MHLGVGDGCWNGCSCRPDARAAQQLYLSCGFEVLTVDFTTAPGQLPYWLMARRPQHAEQK